MKKTLIIILLYSASLQAMEYQVCNISKSTEACRNFAKRIQDLYKLKKEQSKLKNGISRLNGWLKEAQTMEDDRLIEMYTKQISLCNQENIELNVLIKKLSDDLLPQNKKHQFRIVELTVSAI